MSHPTSIVVGQKMVIHLSLVVQVVHHDPNPLALPSTGNSDVIVMSKCRLGNFHVKNNLRKKIRDV